MMVDPEQYQELSTEYIKFNLTDNTTWTKESTCAMETVNFLSTPLFHSLVYFMYCTVFIMSLFGNGLVCFIVQCSPRMKTVTNYFIMNLAIGDILMTLLCIPFSFVPMLVLRFWPFGMVMCKVVNYTQAVSVFVSAYTLVAISIDRYMAIMRPLKPRLGRVAAKFIVCGVWASACATAAPIFIVSEIKRPTKWHELCEEDICLEQWENTEYSQQYSFILMTLQFALPLTALVLTYARIAHVVWGGRTPGEAETARDSRMQLAKRKMIKMMLTVVVVFTVCWLPLNTFIILWTLHEEDVSWAMWPGMPYVWFVSHWLAMSHCCYNPIIYCYMNSRYRRGFQQALSCVLRPRTEQAACRRGRSAEGLPLSVITCLLLKDHINCKDYCSPVFCGDSKQHTMCKYKIEGPASNCVIYEKLIKSEKDKQEILDKINSRRNKVSSGEIQSLPSANNMLKLEWNEELALSAQRWADQCITNGTSLDVCRDSENTSVGQNVATVYGEAPRMSPATLVDLWYMELLHFNASITSRYQRSSTTNLAHYDYFTQLVWGHTRQVGCGASKFQERLPENKNRSIYRLVCNFLPSGNIERQRIYDEGIPCTHCPYDNNCDSHFTSLCDQSHIFMPKENDKFQTKINKLSKDNFRHHTDIYFDTKKTSVGNESHQESTEFNNIDSVTDSFDLFAHLLNTYNKSETQKTERTGLCKEVLAVDEFIDLLRKKLSTDNMLKDLLTTKSTQSDIQFSDPKIDAIVGKLYSKKTPSTTLKSTNSDVINSTLLVDLVEAVIFRNRDKISTVEIVIPSTEDAEGRTIQMQAELGEIQRNLEFKGHYFFPEEDDENQSNPTEFYYDQSNIPVSEIVLEIEQLKRNKETNDFIEDILESEFNTDTVTPNHVIASDNMNDATKSPRKIHEFWKYSFNDSKAVKRLKRDTNVKRSHNEFKYNNKLYRYDDIVLNYNEILKLLANDLKRLKLNSKYHCAHNLATLTFVNISITITLIVTFTLTYLYLFYYNLYK